MVSVDWYLGYYRVLCGMGLNLVVVVRHYINYRRLLYNIAYYMNKSSERMIRCYGLVRDKIV